MSGSATVLRFAQAGIELPRGTPHDPTRKAYGQAKIQSVKRRRLIGRSEGTFWSTHDTYPGEDGSAVTWSGPLAVQDMPFWLSHFLSGSVTPVLVSSTYGTYLWDFTPQGYQPDSSRSSTWEYAVGPAVYRSSFCLGNSLSIEGQAKQNSPILLTGQLIGHPRAQVTATSVPDSLRSLTLPAYVRVYVDDGSLNFGSTQITGRVTAFKWSMEFPVVPYWYADNTNCWADARHDYLRTGCQITMRVGTPTQGEILRWEGSHERKIRLEIGGGQAIGVPGVGYGLTPYGTAPYGDPVWAYTSSFAQLLLDTAGYWHGSVFSIDGSTSIVTFDLLSAVTGQINADARAQVITTISDLAAA